MKKAGQISQKNLPRFDNLLQQIYKTF